MKNTLEKILLSILGGLILLFVLLLLFLSTILQGCATTNKAKSLHKETINSISTTSIDSSAHKTIDSSKVTKANSVTVKETDGSFERETVILFDTSIIKNTATREDYFPHVKSIIIKEKGLNKAKETKTEAKNDSAGHREINNSDLTKNVKTDFHKTESDKIKTVKRTSYWGWLWLLMMIPAYLVYRNWPKIKTLLKFV